MMDKKGSKEKLFVSAASIFTSIVLFFYTASLFAGQQAGENSLITYSGGIIDAQEQPVSGAIVKLYVPFEQPHSTSIEYKLVKETVTKADGKFSFNTAIEYSYSYRRKILAEKEGLSIGWEMALYNDNMYDIEIMLTEPKELTGFVVDEDSNPVPDARVGILYMYRTGTQNPQPLMLFENTDFLTTRTDSNGKFTFRNLPADAKLEFLVKKSGRATVSTRTRSSLPKFAPGQTDIRIVQPSESKIEGRVLEKDSNKPVGGVLIIPFPIRHRGYGIQNVLSNPDGTFSISQLPEGKYRLLLYHLPGGQVDWVAHPVEIQTRKGRTESGIKIEAVKGGLAEVLVTESDSNKPVNGVTVWFADANEAGSSGITDKQGITRIRLMPGKYNTLSAMREDYSYIPKEQSIVIEEGKNYKFNIQLIRQSEITGRVTNSAGKPLDGVKLHIIPFGVSSSDSDPTGKFKVKWEPRPLDSKKKINLIARDEKRNLANIVEINKETKNLDVRLKDGVILTGRVVDPNHKPVWGAAITVSLMPGNSNYNIAYYKVLQKSAEARFEIRAIPPENKYEVSVSSEDFGKSHISVDAADAVDNKLDMKEVILRFANLSVSGIVVDVNDQPISGARVFSYGEIQPSREVKTDNNGRFTLERVCAGEIEIVADLTVKKMNTRVKTQVDANNIKIVIK